MLKWLFGGLWLLCLIAFIAGQLLAPPDYHLMPGNPWGSLFGISVVLGIIFFILSIVFFVLDASKQKKVSVTEQRKIQKYNFSLGRLISRFILTGVLVIVFGLAMIPFMRDASGLMFEQRAAIGGQNMIRAVVLWGLFTTIVCLFTFWRKHFRMVSILLIACWVLGSGLVLAINMFDANEYRCSRATPYTMPSEFNRSLDLIAQRTQVDTELATGTIWQSVYNFRNCLNIQYAEVDDPNVEAYFEHPLEVNQEYLQDLRIVVNPSYKNYDDLTLATLLSHELVHAGQYINEALFNTTVGCYESEAQAFSAQHSFILSLNEEEQRSIYTRLQDDESKNPTIAVLLLTGQRGNEATKACTELQIKNNLSDEQMFKCSWEGLESKLLEDIKSEPYYLSQCLGQ